MSRPISDTWFIAIKQATRDLVHACNGIVAAGEIAHVSKSEVSRWQSATDPDIISLPAALALEAECSAPLVTAAMARLHGRALQGEGPADAATIAAGHAQMMQHAGRLMQDMAQALGDGRITPGEAGALRRVSGDVQAALSDLCALLEAAQIRPAPFADAVSRRGR